MSNLLPEENKKEFARIYHLRLLSVILFGVVIFWLVAIVFLVPSFLVFTARINGARIQTASIRNERALVEAKNLEKEVERTRELVSRVSNVEESTESTIIKKILFYKSPGVSFNYFSIPDRTHTALRGIARNRVSLDTFVQALEKDESIIKVDSPLSNLIAEKNILFTVSIEWNDPVRD